MNNNNKKKQIQSNYLQETQLDFKDICRLKVKGWKKISSKDNPKKQR